MYDKPQLSVKFGNRRYGFEQTILTQISSDYVPDWDVFRAVRESLQNALDEGTETSANVGWWQTENGYRFYDKGRGVAFGDILFLGVSGKRGKDGLIGQHGEGEVVSFLVAAREGVEKTMASQDWLAKGRLTEEQGHKVLALDVYRSRTNLQGTRWEYEGPGVVDAAERAIHSFRQVEKRQKAEQRERRRRQRAANDQYYKRREKRRKSVRAKRVLLNEPGVLFTRGMEVGKMGNLLFGYDLDATPGRDRAAFSWQQIKDEVQELLKEHAKVEHVEALLRAAVSGYHYRELELLSLALDSKLVKRAVYKYTGSRKKFAVVVAGPGDTRAALADAQNHGDVRRVILFQDSVPAWAMSLPSVSAATSAQVKSAPRALPSLVEDAASFLVAAFPSRFQLEQLSFSMVHRFGGESTRACENDGKITFARTHLKEMTFWDFVSTFVHEAAHWYSSAGDCTRQHERAVRELLCGLLENTRSDEAAAKAFNRAEARFNRYVS